MASPTSEYRGVSWDRVEEKWRARAYLDGRRINIGMYFDEQEAIDARAAWDAENKGYDGETKVCGTCHERKVLTEYATDSPGYGGVNARCKACRNRKTATWKTNNREKYRAHMKVSEALQRGVLVRPNLCEDCLERVERPDAHHDDYSKPLDVRWLCRSCHRAEHVRRLAGESE